MKDKDAKEKQRGAKVTNSSSVKTKAKGMGAKRLERRRGTDALMA